MKQCSKCLESKLLTEFNKRTISKDGLNPICRPCISILQSTPHIKNLRKEWAKVNRDKLLVQKRASRKKPHRVLVETDYRLRVKYGISLNDYDNMLKHQDNKCAICEQVETRERRGKLQKLSVDHNHKTGKVRGILCDRCNLCIGQLEDNPQLFIKASNYLQRHKE